MPLPRSAGLGDNFAVRRLPEPDSPRLVAEHHGVVPAPHHSLSAAGSLSDGYQMTGGWRPGQLSDLARHHMGVHPFR